MSVQKDQLMVRLLFWISLQCYCCTLMIVSSENQMDDSFMKSQQFLDDCNWCVLSDVRSVFLLYTVIYFWLSYMYIYLYNRSNCRFWACLFFLLWLLLFLVRQSGERKRESKHGVEQLIGACVCVCLPHYSCASHIGKSCVATTTMRMTMTNSRHQPARPSPQHITIITNEKVIYQQYYRNRHSILFTAHFGHSQSIYI